MIDKRKSRGHEQKGSLDEKSITDRNGIEKGV